MCNIMRTQVCWTSPCWQPMRRSWNTCCRQGLWNLKGKGAKCTRPMLNFHTFERSHSLWCSYSFVVARWEMATASMLLCLVSSLEASYYRYLKKPNANRSLASILLQVRPDQWSICICLFCSVLYQWETLCKNKKRNNYIQTGYGIS